MEWRRAYDHKIVPAEEVAGAVNSGDTVAISLYPHPTPIMDALAARKDDLKGVKLLIQSPAYDPGWLQAGWQGAFSITAMMFLGELIRPAHDEKRIDYWPMVFSHEFKPFEERCRNKIDMLLVVCSPPDDHGFCSFGDSLWDKRRLAQNSVRVAAQVDEAQIRTYGTNYIHVSEIDYLVDHTPPAMSREEALGQIGQIKDSQSRAELERILPFMSARHRWEVLPWLCRASLRDVRAYAREWGWVDPPEEAVKIAGYVSELIRDGDTIQVGEGTPSAFMPRLGVFDDRRDLGLHSEMGARGLLKLVERGVINGSRKTVNRDRAVLTGLYGCGMDEISFAADNPLVELRDSEYVANIRTVAAHDNFVSINNTLSVDLSGQINSETVLGSRLWNGTGGQPELHIGAVLSRGGRALTLLRSTALGGAVSRIVPQQEEGAMVTIPRTFADIVVTEYGVARLLGKSIRERARELIAIAHPDYRADLKKAAERLYYP